MVASTHWLASASGMAVLERGGNAFDAAVAAGLVLQVVEPHLNGPGGDMPALVYEASRRQVSVLCGQGPAPRLATVERFHSLGLDQIPGTGLLAPCVPGAVGAWLTLLRDLGTWRLRDVVEFAAGYAHAGHPLLPRVAATIEDVAQLFQTEWSTSAEIWLKQGRGPRAGELFSNRVLAAMFGRLLTEAEARAGRENEIEGALAAWYEGFVAEAIDDFLRQTQVQDSSGRRHAGLLRADDMAGWRPGWERSCSARYGAWRVHKPGPWSQGPVFLQQLALLQALGLQDLEPGTAEFVHLVVEAAKLAFADREAWYGDPACMPDVTPELMAPSYVQERSKLIAEHCSLELRPGSAGGRAPLLPDYGAAAEAGASPGLGDPTFTPAVPQTGDTCHLDVVDRWGNLVSATPSGGWLQSSPAIPALGFCLGTRAQIFNLTPGHPNVLAPSKRPRTTLSPSLAENEDGGRLAFGTPGADQQDQWALNFFVRLAQCGENLQTAIDAPMFHTDHFPRSFWPHDSRPGSLYIEDRAGQAVILELRRRGHQVAVQPGWSLGRLSAAGRDARSRLLRAASNPRGDQGYAAGR
ncbi:MAG: gamma-glutamyltransferase [Candidatus Dormibacteraeota bacterium]|uniref:Gamma-glutamyltransferase n=1 Tax=Candidatus Dormiibacter inghamiae TaxID=3127013 RepID=A0A934KIT7_9BACT|nr:gamma-glutamyltransferase [Candidatus Dormibacteraeota bacterium]MBJ7605309.1 gamma-glutamyltransferase [Candidatus Dormibacteraeota bacterium]